MMFHDVSCVCVCAQMNLMELCQGCKGGFRAKVRARCVSDVSRLKKPV